MPCVCTLHGGDDYILPLQIWWSCFRITHLLAVLTKQGHCYSTRWVTAN